MDSGNFQREEAEIITHTVIKQLDRVSAKSAIHARALALPTEDRQQFEPTVLAELDGLHEGNIARCSVSLSEFRQWSAGWTEK